VLIGASPDWPSRRLLCGYSRESIDGILAAVEEGWGSGVTLPLAYPSGAGDAAVLEWWGRLERMAASPGAAVATLEMATRSTPSPASRPRVPTLVLHRGRDHW